MKRECERLWEVDALREGRLEGREAESFVRHRATCDACRRRFTDDEKLRALGRSLPVAPVDPLRSRRLRQSILRRAALGDDRSRSRRFAVGAALAALAIVAVLVGSIRFYARHVTPAQSHGAASDSALGAFIDAEPGATWSETTEGTLARVTLTSGALTLRVRHRAPGERFIVDLPDGELEVRGTEFRVEVDARTTRSVRVREGLVALRRFGAGEVMIGANEQWSAAAVPSAIPSAPGAAPVTVDDSPDASSLRLGGAGARSPSAITPAATGRPPSARPSPDAGPSLEDSSEYEVAIGLFASQRYDEAARRLHAFVVAHPDRVEAEDAAFMEASALAHVGRADAAGVVAERFLDRYPASLHASDAAVLAVRAARARGDCAHARAVASLAIADEQARAAALGVCAAP